MQRRNSPKENPTRESLRLKEGEVYTLIFTETLNHREKQRKKEEKDEAHEMLQAPRGI